MNQHTREQQLSNIRAELLNRYRDENISLHAQLKEYQDKLDDIMAQTAALVIEQKQLSVAVNVLRYQQRSETS